MSTIKTTCWKCSYEKLSKLLLTVQTVISKRPVGDGFYFVESKCLRCKEINKSEGKLNDLKYREV